MADLAATITVNSAALMSGDGTPLPPNAITNGSSGPPPITSDPAALTEPNIPDPVAPEIGGPYGADPFGKPAGLTDATAPVNVRAAAGWTLDSFTAVIAFILAVLAWTKAQIAALWAAVHAIQAEIMNLQAQITAIKSTAASGGGSGSGSGSGGGGSSGGGASGGSGGQPLGSTLPSGFTAVWVESFDSGVGMFSRVWGPGVDTSVPGQLTMHSTGDNVDSGAMIPPTGASAGNGYGLYSFVCQTNGVIGGYALTWPATDNWPGPEMDVLEITEDGGGYATLHWSAGGSNAYNSVGWGTDVTQTHTYSMLWEEGAITYYLDGIAVGSQTSNVGADFAHGGENTCAGIGMQTWWNSGGSRGSYFTCYEASYSVRA